MTRPRTVTTPDLVKPDTGSVHLIVAGPVPTVVMAPFASTVATPLAEDSHFMVAATASPVAVDAVHENAAVSPNPISIEPGEKFNTAAMTAGALTVTTDVAKYVIGAATFSSL